MENTPEKLDKDKIAKEMHNELVNQKNTVVIAYHNNCIDGFTSAWVTDRAMKENGVDTILLPMDYTHSSYLKLCQLLKDQSYRLLYVVDFSLKLEWLDELKFLAPKTPILILDHHKTAFEMYAPELASEGLTPTSNVAKTVGDAMVILDNGLSGAGLCWKYFHGQDTYDVNHRPVPMLVQYVQDYDLWRFDLGERTKWINKYLMQATKCLDIWDSLADRLEDPKEQSYRIGENLYNKHLLMVAQIVDKAQSISILGNRGLCVECPGELVSSVGHELANRSGTFGATYWIDPGANEIKWSFRSNDDYDVSAIAKRLGGGGHKNAAGVTFPLFSEQALIQE